MEQKSKKKVVQPCITDYFNQTYRPKTQLVNIKTYKGYKGNLVNIGRAPGGIEKKDYSFGNPFIIGRDGTQEDVVRLFKEWFFHDDQRKLRDRVEHELKGKILACYCVPLSCHGQIYVDYINFRRG
jgi:hypothetical protein